MTVENEPGPEDKPVDVHFHDGWFRTWHTPNCVIFTRDWSAEAAKWCDCEGYHRKRVPVQPGEPRS